MKCQQELCEYWGGDGRICPCALLEFDDVLGDGTWYDEPELRWYAEHAHQSVPLPDGSDPVADGRSW